MISKHFFILLAGMIMLCGCNVSIDEEKLYGRWKYIKVENRNADPADGVTPEDLAVQKPYIAFSKNKDLVIVWGGEKLSSGKFRTEENRIHYTEHLADGQKREFPFYVSKLTKNEIIFETTGQDASKITAVKSSQSP